MARTNEPDDRRPMKELTKAQWKLLDREIAAATKWLDSDQPEGAWITHHGISYKGKIEDLSMRLIPQAVGGRPVFVFDVDDYTVRLTPEFVKRAEALVAKHAGLVSNRWNGILPDGYACSTVSIQPDRLAGKAVLRLVKTYSAGCPDHEAHGHRKGDVFCGKWPKALKAEIPPGWGR